MAMLLLFAYSELRDTLGSIDDSTMCFRMFTIVYLVSKI